MKVELFGYPAEVVLVFVLVVVVCLAVDLMAHKKDKAISVMNAAAWSALWVAVSMAFACFIHWESGQEKASLFLAGYFLEKSLSVDNLFLFIAIFASFGVKDEFQHRVLYYGVLGAIVLRMVFIGLGSWLASLHPAVFMAFGVAVLFSAWKLWRETNSTKEDDIDFSNHWAVRLMKKAYPVYPRIESHDFFIKVGGIKHVTPLFLCLVVIEAADVMFALDSVPAVIAVTEDPLLVYTSNIFAIMGLRSMYFLLVAANNSLHYLSHAVIAILVFIGVKMLFHGTIHIPPEMNLFVIGGFLSGGIAASLLKK